MLEGSDATVPWQKRHRGKLGMGASVGALVGSLAFVYGGGGHRGPGRIQGPALPKAVVRARLEAQRRAEPPPSAGGKPSRQILFGDLHVHTTFSGDAFARSLPLLQGEGAHPPADACDFARYCSGLDFFAITDHAEGISPAHWAETKQSVRECNAVAGDPEDPDLVAFAGWEWSQVGLSPEDHFGHKNVIFRDLGESELPTRVIAATGILNAAVRAFDARVLAVPLLEFSERQAYLDLAEFQRELRAMQECPSGVDVRALPPSCRETAATPRELFDKLAEWGFDSLVIPHGTTWGIYTPPGSRWDKQLVPAQHDPSRQFLFEVFSGHGNSEEYRPWEAVAKGPSGEDVCPEPTPSYEPCCWRAGEIVRARCGPAPAAECEARVARARAAYLAAGTSGHLTVPGSKVEDFLDCGQCRDCFLPAFNYRPGGSAQAVLATGDFTDPAQPKSYPFGLLASSDNHTARPGTGYKEVARRKMTEAFGARDEAWHERLLGAKEAPAPEAVAVDPRTADVLPWRLVDFERNASFFMTGGLVAVHSEGRSRGAIWDALKRREVYGTSGDRILLWFDLQNGPDGESSMGSEVRMREPPRFVVRAAGAHEQLAGCPASAAPGDVIRRLCLGECDNPGERRRRITRVEVVRIRPQRSRGEDIAPLIEDPWRTLPCPAGGESCRVELEDAELPASARDAVYYVRAIQEPTPAINAASLRCERGPGGSCARVRPCWGDYRTPSGDDCLAPAEERAWSSPIFVRWDGS